MPSTTGIAKRGARVAAICTALPEATERGGQHSRFSVRDKTSAHYLDDHHGTSPRSTEGAAGHAGVADQVRPRTLLPAVVPGPKGWIGLRIDTPKVDWGDLDGLIRECDRPVARKRLAALV